MVSVAAADVETMALVYLICIYIKIELAFWFIFPEQTLSIAERTHQFTDFIRIILKETSHSNHFSITH